MSLIHKLFVLLIFLLKICEIAARPADDLIPNSTVTEPRVRDHEKTLQRTISVVEHRSAFGRIVLLVCQRPCKYLRSSIPQLIHDYNDQKRYTADDVISYHYHYLRLPLPFYNVTKSNREPQALYIAAGNVEEFQGDINDRLAFTSWLSQVDKVHFLAPKSSEELDQYLNQAENCHQAFLLILHDPRQCPFDIWKNAARVVYAGTGVSTILLEQPLENTLSVTLYRRLFSLPQQCLLVFLIHNNQYTQPFTDLIPDMIVHKVRETLAFATCAYGEDKIFTKKGIRSSLTDLQMEYYVREVDLRKLEHRKSYIAVGLAGGIAVIALAISIFWGLNGKKAVHNQDDRHTTTTELARRFDL